MTIWRDDFLAETAYFAGTTALDNVFFGVADTEIALLPMGWGYGTITKQVTGTEEARTLLTVLMVLDAVIAIILIAAILGQEAKSAGMGGLDGGGNTVFSGKARGMDALLARVTIVFAVFFAAITLVIAKMTM